MVKTILRIDSKRPRAEALGLYCLFINQVTCMNYLLMNFLPSLITMPLLLLLTR